MPQEELFRRLADHEDNFVERKPPNVNAREIRRTVVAFANSVTDGQYAVLFIGVHDDGRIEGVEKTDEKQKAIREICEQDCYPPIRFSSEVLRTDGGQVVAVVIVPSNDRPHFSGPAFVRRGSESVAASPEIYAELVHSRNSKAGAILKLKNQVVTVLSLQHRLGQAKHVADPNYREGVECSVEGCDGQAVRLRIRASGQVVAEPLDHVTVNLDEEQHRPMLVVTGY